MKKSAPKTASKSAPKPKRGNLTKSEIQPLAIAAKKAFEYQQDLGNVEPGQTFNDWRHDQCQQAVGKPGITSCSHDHYRPLMAHFQLLGGQDEKAYQNLTTTGQASKQPGDTHESRRNLAHLIAKIITDHIALADTPWEQILAEWSAQAKVDWEICQPGEPFPGLEKELVIAASERKQAISENDGPIRQGYLVYLIRQKTRRPDLQLGNDLVKAVAERCTVKQLTEIRDTIVNRISAKEGIGSPKTRNKSQSSAKAKAARSPKNLDQPRW